MAKRIKAKQRKTSKETERINALLGKVSPWEVAPAWSATIKEPGLHVRKSPDWQGNNAYVIVRAVGIDEGSGMCMRVFRDLAGTSQLTPYEISQSQFQRIEE